MQICPLTQIHNHASIQPLSFLQAGCLSCHPTNSIKALKAIALKACIYVYVYIYIYNSLQLVYQLLVMLVMGLHPELVHLFHMLILSQSLIIVVLMCSCHHSLICLSLSHRSSHDANCDEVAAAGCLLDDCVSYCSVTSWSWTHQSYRSRPESSEQTASTRWIARTLFSRCWLREFFTSSLLLVSTSS